MKPHFASTIHAVRQMNPRSVGLAAPPLPTLPAGDSRPTVRKADAAAVHGVRRIMVLPEGETLTIVASDGRPLLEIAGGEKGPEIRLIHDDLRIECPGQLDLAARTITLEASEDVMVRGRTIRLN